MAKILQKLLASRSPEAKPVFKKWQMNYC